MQKKILIATGIFPPDIGGPATYSKLLRDLLPKRGFSVEVISFGEVRHLPKIIRHLVYFFKVFISARGCEIIYAQDPVSVGLPAMLAAKILSKKFYLKIVGDYAWEQGVQRFGVTDLLDEFSKRDVYSFRVQVMKYIQTMVANHADKIITPSNYLKGIIKNWGVDGDKVTVIYNGFRAPELSADKDTLRKKLGIEGYTLLSIGRLVPWKGFEMVIQSIPALLQEIPNIQLLIAGEGPDREMLEKKVVELGASNYIKFLGKLSQEKLFEYIKASDLFVLNTSYEGFSHQLLEVMALGTPIVTTFVGGNKEIIEGAEQGTFIAYNNIDEFKNAIRYMHAQPSENIKSIVHSAQKRAQTFSDERMLNETSAVLAQA